MGFRGTERQVFVIPDVIEDHVEKSNDFGKVRRSIRRAIYDLFSAFPESDEFTKEDMEEMRAGRSPFVPESQRVGKRKKIELHHKEEKQRGKSKKFANRLANLIGLSPLYHDDGNYIDDVEHYGQYHGKRKARLREERANKYRKQV